MQIGGIYITKINKHGIPAGTRGTVYCQEEHEGKMRYKFLSDDDNDYQGWYAGDELEEVTDDKV